MSKPLAVIAGDIHYNLKNLELSDKGTRMAIAKANELNIPFIANGDTHDSKANLRGECVNAMIETFKTAKIKSYVNIGNHCRIHEKSTEHSLNFLEPYSNIINTTSYINELKSWIISYHSDLVELRLTLKAIEPKSLLIMHQGLTGSNMGDYVIDHSALNPEDLKDFRTILSHYHARQDIKCGYNTASFIGSLYTQSYTEASDLPKGFQILMDDGSLEFVPTNLRKHVVLELEVTKEGTKGFSPKPINKNDLVWVKVRGTKEQLLATPPSKSSLCYMLGVDNLKLDIIPTDTVTQAPANKNYLTQEQLLDSMIDSLSNTSGDVKSRLKSKWKDLK